jgi:TRAP-type C4-dicarboxylate transport system permease small subunit
MIKALNRATTFASKVLVGLAATGLVAMVIIIAWQVFGRYVLRSSPSWTEQAAMTLMIWFVLLAAAAGVREGFHIRIVAVEESVPAAVRKTMRILADLLMSGAGVAMAVWGGEMVMRTWSHVIPSLGLPRGLAYLGLPISGALIALFSLERIVEEATGANAPDKSLEKDA